MLHQLARQQILQYYRPENIPEIFSTFLSSLKKISDDPNLRKLIEPLWQPYKIAKPLWAPKTPAGLFSPHADLLPENNKVIFFTINVKRLRFSNISSGSKNIYGYSPLDFYNHFKLWQRIIHPADNYLVPVLEQNLGKGIPVVCQFRVVNKDRSLSWVESKLVPTLNSVGELAEIGGILIDRTENYLNEKRLREKEQRLIESERKYRIIFENNPQPMWVLDDGSLRILDVNTAAITHFGYTKEEFLLMSAFDLRTPAERSRLAMLEKNNPGKINNTGTWELFRKDGAIRVVEISAEPIDFDGKRARLILSHDVTDRVSAEKKLQLSNERYELATRATNDAIWDWNLCENKLYWSDGYEKLFGYRTQGEERNVHSWSSRIHPDDVQRVTNGLMKKISDPKSDFWEDEYRYIKADGSIAFIYDRAFINYEGGVPVRVVGAMQDITRRKLTEEFLSESEANLKNLLENTDTAYLLLDEQARVVSLNQAARQLVNDGIIAPVSEGKYYEDVVPAERKNDVNHAIEKVVATRRQTSYELCYVSPANISFWLHVSIHPVINKDKLIGFSVAINNITDQKMAEQLLKESEANLRTIFDNTQQSYIFLDKDFRIVSFNQRAFGCVRQEFGSTLKAGKLFTDYFKGESLRSIQNRLAMILSGKKVKYEKSFQHADGTENWYELNLFPVKGNKSDLLGIIVTAEDITQRKNIELEKERMTSDLLLRNKTLEQFAYIISHNLRSPVANITGLASIILDSPSMNKHDFNRCIEGLALSVKKLDDIIIDLNYILQVRQKINEKKENISFADLIVDIQTSINTLITSEEVTMITDFTRAPTIFSIKSYLNSIFYNLIVNSIKYRDPNRRLLIKISTRLEYGKLIIVFRDNGLGIDLVIHGNKIFGLYKKFHNHVEGKGMGLYMVKTQVEMLDGKIDISSAVNQGAEFRIEFANIQS